MGCEARHDLAALPPVGLPPLPLLPSLLPVLLLLLLLPSLLLPLLSRLWPNQCAHHGTEPSEVPPASAVPPAAADGGSGAAAPPRRPVSPSARISFRRAVRSATSMRVAASKRLMGGARLRQLSRVGLGVLKLARASASSQILLLSSKAETAWRAGRSREASPPRWLRRPPRGVAVNFSGRGGGGGGRSMTAARLPSTLENGCVCVRMRRASSLCRFGEV